jgi:hypothetical protein
MCIEQIEPPEGRVRTPEATERGAAIPLAKIQSRVTSDFSEAGFTERETGLLQNVADMVEVVEEEKRCHVAEIPRVAKFSASICNAVCLFLAVWRREWMLTQKLLTKKAVYCQNSKTGLPKTRTLR